MGKYAGDQALFYGKFYNVHTAAPHSKEKGSHDMVHLLTEGFSSFNKSI